MKKIFLTVFMILLSGVASWGQDVETTAYPSEDELIEALNQGVISADEYTLLFDLFRNGIDSSNISQLELIPNLSFFEDFYEQFKAGLELGQPSIFNKVSGGYFQYKFYQKFHNQDSRYRSSLNYKINSKLEFTVKADREYSGRERIVYRNFIYSLSGSYFEKIIFGNFSKKFGLGSVIGYRGKIVSFSSTLDKESLLFPDYGGQNGIYLLGENEKIKSEILTHYIRDNEIEIFSLASNISVKSANNFPGIISSLSRIKNRNSQLSEYDFKSSLYKEFRNDNDYLRIEATYQDGIKQSFAFLQESNFSIGRSRMNFAGWLYGKDFIDLNSGSKTASITATEHIEEVDFSYSSKRKHQKGMHIKSSTALYENLSFDNSLIFAGKNNDTSNFDILTGLTKIYSPSFSARLDFQGSIKKRNENSIVDKTTQERYRFETKYRSQNFYLRSYFAYNRKSGRGDYLSLFFNFKKQINDKYRINVWSNLGKYHLNRKKIEYFYGYFEQATELSEKIQSVAKISYSYSNPSLEFSSSEVTISISMRVIL